MSIDVETRELLIDAARREGLDTVVGAFAYAGGEDLVKGGLGARRRTRVELTDGTGRCHVVYLKRYGPERLTDRLRRIVQRRSLAGPAAVEAENIRVVSELGIATMDVLSCGEEPGGLSLRAGRGYIVVTEVPGDALSRGGKAYLAAGGDEAGRRLADELAEMVRTLHGAGWFHRDLYAAHVFLAEGEGRPMLHLIDLARLFRPLLRRFRWRVKDLAALKYSMPAGWVDRHWGRFLDRYLAAPGGHETRYRRAIERKVRAIARRDRRKIEALERKKRNERKTSTQ